MQLIREAFPEKKTPLLLGIAQITRPPLIASDLGKFCTFEKSVKINLGKGVPPNLGNVQKKGFFWEGFPFRQIWTSGSKL